jgi:hypothetical protein
MPYLYSLRSENTIKSGRYIADTLLSRELDIVTNNNSVALVRERTITTGRPPLVGEVSANVCR